MDALLLRVLLRPAGAGDGEPCEVHLQGRWAFALCSLGPGDCLMVQGAVINGDGECCVAPQGSAVVTALREGHLARLDWPALERGELPGWLQLPPVKPVKGQYQYVAFMCSLRDGVDANLWAVVWENMKPGPTGCGSGRSMANLLVVDKSFDQLPCGAWSSASDMPQFSLQVALPGGPAQLPFLCVGDVVRAHRVVIRSKPPRFQNIQMQQHSSLVAFEIGDRCPGQAPADGADIAGGVADDAAGPRFKSLTASENPTIKESDYARARSLQQWLRDKLSQQSLSAYLALVSDIMAGTDAYRDVIVQVLKVCPAEKALLVTDGSTQEPIRVSAAEPTQAAARLFAHVKKRHWLKIRSVALHRGTDGVSLRASAATITRLPAWCFDVCERVRYMQRLQSGPLSVADGPSSAESQELQADRCPRAVGASESAENTLEDGDEDDGVEEVRESESREREAVNRQTALKRQAATYSGSASASSSATPAAAAATPGRVRLITPFDDASTSFERIGDVRRAAQRGKRCHVLGGFRVDGLVGVNRANGMRVESLIYNCCRACGHTFPSPASNVDSRSAKRPRQALPCGHWLFRLEYRFRLRLRDLVNAEDVLVVCVADSSGEFLGAPPAAVVEAPSQERRHAQRMLDMLLGGGADAGAAKHSLGVYRVDGPATPEGAYVVCDTRLGESSAAAGSGS
eukprot:TRINITY_DN10802_c0_g6_i1.p1 TRINITY_DN10802_c0_g6~~TRINITY_DN10802_c0_g6_i1.p1  ORF type:complete len:738 (+),score=119.60 TRINITY_DN10802_c0_g6_i1:156-2216(+)